MLWCTLLGGATLAGGPDAWLAKGAAWEGPGGAERGAGPAETGRWPAGLRGSASCTNPATKGSTTADKEATLVALVA